jgi:hypothetical protein
MPFCQPLKQTQAISLSLQLFVMEDFVQQIESLETALTEVVITSYEGEYDEDTGECSGQATAKLDNGCLYEGFFKCGMLHGRGKFTWPDGVVYEGDLHYNEFTGKGSYSYIDGTVYTGDVLMGLRHGTGTMIHFPCGACEKGDRILHS